MPADSAAGELVSTQAAMDALMSLRPPVSPLRRFIFGSDTSIDRVHPEFRNKFKLIIDQIEHLHQEIASMRTQLPEPHNDPPEAAQGSVGLSGRLYTNRTHTTAPKLVGQPCTGPKLLRKKTSTNIPITAFLNPVRQEQSPGAAGQQTDAPTLTSLVMQSIHPPAEPGAANHGLTLSGFRRVLGGSETQEDPGAAAMSPLVPLPESPQTVPGAAEADFDGYTITQLKQAMAFFSRPFASRTAAVAYLQERHRTTGELPDVRLTAFQTMTPRRRKSMSDRVADWLLDSPWYLLIVTFIPVDLKRMHAHMVSSGLRVPQNLLASYLLAQGVLIAECRDDYENVRTSVRNKGVRYMRDSGGAKQLTLSEILRGHSGRGCPRSRR